MDQQGLQDEGPDGKVWCPVLDRWIEAKLCPSAPTPSWPQPSLEDYSQWATRNAPRDQVTTTIVQGLLDKRLRGFENTNCARVLAQGIQHFDVGVLRGHAAKVLAYDVRDSRFANLTQNEVFANGVTRTLGNSVPYGRDAAFVQGPAGQGILVGPNFFTQPDQPNSALHEMLHMYGGDEFFFEKFQKFGLEPDAYGTGAITEWLARDCRPKAQR